MRLLKHLYFALLLCAAVTCLAACEQQAEQPQAEQSTLPADAPTIYYNDYLGLSISVPPAWHINALSANLSVQQGLTAAPQLIEYGDGSRRMELIDIQSSATSNDAEHSRFCAYAELFGEAVEPAQYVELLISLLEADNSGYTYTILKQEQLPLSRHVAERICLQVSGNSTADPQQTYTEEYYIVPLGQAILVFYINYWPQNEASGAAAFAVLEGITLPEL